MGLQEAVAVSNKNIGPTGIWSINLAKKKHRFDFLLARAIKELFPVGSEPSSTADLGCGMGQYCTYLANEGWPNVVGYEGTKGIVSLPGTYPIIREVDLTDPQLPLLVPQSELVLCLEVAEHIPQDYEEVFVNNIVAICLRWLLISWGHPGQSGTGHVNPRPQEYVIKIFQGKGFEYCSNQTTFLRSRAKEKYFRSNLIFMERTMI